jgi:hypothetical protein
VNVTAQLPLEEPPQPDVDLYTAYRASGLRRYGRCFEDALREPSLRICLTNLAAAINRKRRSTRGH